MLPRGLLGQAKAESLFSGKCETLKRFLFFKSKIKVEVDSSFIELSIDNVFFPVKINTDSD